MPSLKVLLPEFIKYAIGRLAYYYPPLLPDEMIADEIKTGEIKKDLWVPLEDIHDGWEKSGSVGQEVYGAGLAFGIIPRQYFTIPELGAIVFVNYPITGFRVGKNSATFHIEGSYLLKAEMQLLMLSQTVLSTIKVKQKNKSTYREIKAISLGHFELDAAGMIKISW